jgi:probable phosphoglycerate mutase
MEPATPVPQPGLFFADALPSEVLLIRHGRSADVVPGTPESLDPPLSDVGARQAARLAARLDGRPLDAVYASNLARATATAGYLARPRSLRVTTRADLREVHLGDWEGGGFRQRAASRDPEFMRFAAAGRWDAIPGAEPDEELRARAVAAVDDILARHPDGSVAVVCHGGLINAYLAELLGIERSFVAVIENTSVTIVRAGDDGQRVLVTVNDCHHLYDPALATVAG